jgi:hypothetical protein
MKKLIMLAAMLIGCSSQSGSGKLDPGMLLVSLSQDQATQLCDWMANLYGGYGSSVTCDGGSSDFGGQLSGPTDQMSCTAQFVVFKTQFASCQETVGRLQTCLQSQVQNHCSAVPGTLSPACTITSSAQCG